MLSVVLALLVVLISYHSCRAASTPSPKAIILYDGEKEDNIQAEALQIENLLGHFNIPADIIPASAYERGELQNCQYGFFMGCMKEYNVPDVLLRDIALYRGRFFWLGNHLEQLTGSRQKIGIEVKGTIEGVKEVRYHGFTLGKGDPVMNEIEIQKVVKVHATAGDRALPYIVQDRNFWYVADIPFSFVEGSDRYLAFCDILHDFLGIAHEKKHQAVVRIEDINPTSRTEALKEITDILYAEHVPFLISLVPMYMDPATNQEIPLSSRPALVKTIKYAIARGATVVLHGYTHQHNRNSTADFEFWDDERNKPLAQDSPDFVEKRINLALQECFTCNTYPLLWETPHYAASTIDYQTIARHFSTASDRRIFINSFICGQAFPFLIEHDVYGQKIIPEYLGFIPFVTNEDGEDIEAERKGQQHLVEVASNLRCLRDATGGFFFHPFVNNSLLKETIISLKTLGYEFLDVRSLTNIVTTSNKAVVSGTGNIKLSLKDEFLREYYIDAKGKVWKEKISRTKLTRVIKRSIHCPPLQVYVAEGIREKPAHPLKKMMTDLRRRFQSSRQKSEREPRPAILCRKSMEEAETCNVHSYVSTFESLGIRTRQLQSLTSLRNENILIIPQKSAGDLPQNDIKRVDAFLGRGGTLVLEGFSELSRSLGFHRAGRVNVNGVRDTYNGVDFTTSGVMEITSPSDSDKVVFQSRDGFPLGLLRKEKGGIFFLSTSYDPRSGQGYGRFPTMIDILLDACKFTPPLSTPRLEAFFDPGLRQNESVEILAQRWRKAGIRAIHVATWHFYPSYTFDYTRLISVCHKEGISVYAWLELPYLTKAFWQNHPEFREKNFRGKDLVASWRYPLALEDEQCRQDVLGEIDQLFANYEFDGVNLAELYFEGESLNKPEGFAPFHPSALKAFKKSCGFDMREIFSSSSRHYWKHNGESLEKFHAFREELILSLHRDLISYFTAMKEKRKNFDIVVTVLDSILDPRITEKIGVDSLEIARFSGEFPITLSIEDPASKWNLPPRQIQESGSAIPRNGHPRIETSHRPERAGRA